VLFSWPEKFGIGFMVLVKELLGSEGVLADKVETSTS
jgi:hypothetical protein